MDKDNTVRQAGGFIIQLMPFVEDGVVDKLEQKLNSIDSVTSYLDRGFTPEQLLTEILGEFGLEIHDKMDGTVPLQLQPGTCGKGVDQRRKKEFE